MSQNINDNLKTISNNNVKNDKNSIDQEKNNMMYKLLENRINDMEKEIAISIIYFRLF